MRTKVAVLIASLAMLLGGCATRQAPLPLSEGVLGSQSGKVGVAITPVPRPDTAFPGANCLLCIATASAMNASLTRHAQALPTDEFTTLPQQLASVLRKKGAQPKLIKEPLDLSVLPDSSARGTNVAAKDFTSLRQKYGIDKLLLVQVQSVGYVRA